MKKYEYMFAPIFLITVGLITLLGVNLFGSAILEAAAWKQNVILGIILIFAMLPTSIRNMKATWMMIGYALAFFMFGGANIIGTVEIILGLEKIILLSLTLFTTYRIWSETWLINKLYVLIPIFASICIVILFTIQDQNIVGSSVDVLINLSLDDFKSDKGFHIYLGIAGVLSGISELLLQIKANKETIEQ